MGYCQYCTLRQIEQNILNTGRVIHYVNHPHAMLKVWLYALEPSTDFEKLTHRERKNAFVAALVKWPETCRCSEVVTSTR
jgi:hypothetical protein